MSELAGFGETAWLPARVQRAQAAEDARERAEARRAEAERAAEADRAHDRHLEAYRLAAEARGETVSALALAMGREAGCSVQDVLSRAQVAADHEDIKQAARAKREAGIELDHVEVGRADLAGYGYAIDRQIRQLEDMHRELVRWKVRHDYPGAVEAARAKSDRRAMIEWQ